MSNKQVPLPLTERVIPEVDEIRSDPSASYWLVESLDAALKRDPVDAVNDAEILADVLSKWCESRLAEFLTSAYDKTMAAVRKVYQGLTDDEQLALNLKTVVIRYNAMRIKEAGSHQTSMVTIRQRAVRGSKSNGQSK